MKVAICDSSHAASEQIRTYIQQLASKKNYNIDIDIFYTGSQLLLKDFNQYNVIILDVALDDENGISIAEKIRLKNKVVTIIFLTALSHYATAGYKVSAYRFLIKPLDYTSFVQELDELFYELNNTDNNYIEVTDNGHIYHMDIREIIYIEVMNHTLKYQLANQTVTTNGSMKTLEKRLHKFNFVRIHNSYMINMDYISCFSRTTVTMNDNIEINISRNRVNNFKKSYMQYLGRKGLLH